MASKQKFTGKNNAIAKFLGEDAKTFRDPGFCLGCGESVCECDDSVGLELKDMGNGYLGISIGPKKKGQKHGK